MKVIFRNEERRRQDRMEKEASLIHREIVIHFDESEEGAGVFDPEEALLDELLRKEEEEVMTLLATREESDEMMDMEDVIMTDIDDDEGK